MEMKELERVTALRGDGPSVSYFRGNFEGGGDVCFFFVCRGLRFM
jgi:hypothetical protein